MEEQEKIILIDKGDGIKVDGIATFETSLNMVVALIASVFNELSESLPKELELLALKALLKDINDNMMNYYEEDFNDKQ